MTFSYFHINEYAVWKSDIMLTLNRECVENSALVSVGSFTDPN